MFVTTTPVSVEMVTQ